MKTFPLTDILNTMLRLHPKLHERLLSDFDVAHESARELFYLLIDSKLTENVEWKEMKYHHSLKVIEFIGWEYVEDGKWVESQMFMLSQNGWLKPVSVTRTLSKEGITKDFTDKWENIKPTFRKTLVS